MWGAGETAGQGDGFDWRSGSGQKGTDPPKSHLTGKGDWRSAQAGKKERVKAAGGQVAQFGETLAGDWQIWTFLDALQGRLQSDAQRINRRTLGFFQQLQGNLSASRLKSETADQGIT